MMHLTIHNCEQGSPEWYAARLGVVTGSELPTVLAKGKGVIRRTYLLKLAGEQITNEPAENYTNSYMERGKQMEGDARSTYMLIADVQLTQVGFVYNSAIDVGCSPDALIGADGVLEIKTCAPHILAEHLLREDFPPSHKAQCQGALWVTCREWVDLVCYWPRMPLLIRRAYRDEKYIEEMALEVHAFQVELEQVVTRLRAMQGPVEDAA